MSALRKVIMSERGGECRASWNCGRIVMRTSQPFTQHQSSTDQLQEATLNNYMIS
jgi:hypothetical protein